MTRPRRIAVVTTLCALLAGSTALLPAALASPGDPVDPTTEARNFAITAERPADFSTPTYQARLAAVSNENGLHALASADAGPTRNFLTDACWSGYNGCAGDARLYGWTTEGYGIVQPVLFTALNGARLSGHVWATKAGPARRPGIVITNGSVQADEQMYWYAAQTLAKAGYVVLTFDPRGRGRATHPGQGVDRQEGVPAQSDGRPFFDGTEDALDFFLSMPARPYRPAPEASDPDPGRRR